MNVLNRVRGQGTADPFVARIWVGIIELREQALRFKSGDFTAVRDAFDLAYQPVLDALDTLRNANTVIQQLIDSHRSKIESAIIVSFQPRAVSIDDTIDEPLRAQCERLLNAGSRATKGVQPVLECLNLRVGCLFQRQIGFQRGLSDLEAGGHKRLVTYLQQVRPWSERLISRRNSLEHNGWRLPQVEYTPVGSRVAMQEPEVDGTPITRFADHMVRRIIAFIEELTAYGLANLLPAPTILAEIPPERRDPSRPTRFCVDIARAGISAWQLAYDDQGFR